MKRALPGVLAGLMVVWCAWAQDRAATEPATQPVEFVDASFENASPLWYETAADGTLLVHLIYDRERNSPNRAAGHIHFRLHAKTGTAVTLEFKNLENVWNGRPGSISRELKAVVISEDGVKWRSVPTISLAENRIQLRVELSAPQVYVARVEPYRLSDLERLIKEIRVSPLVQMEPIGKTVQGRELEMIRVGDPAAPRRVFVRARAHPWESGGNWVVEGLIRRLLKDDDAAISYRKQYCLYVMPMANKDGVARGMTRFNVRGMDLNRNWDRPADAELSPENHALERWLEKMARKGLRPDLAVDLHNDGNGQLHISRPPVPDLERHLGRMAAYEALLRQHTWFREGSTKATFRNAGTLGEGFLQRFGVDAVVQELNCNWIEGAKEPPLGRHWVEFGEGLARVFGEYFAGQVR